jgi:hypothetical protein
MAARAYWKGHLRVSLASIPLKQCGGDQKRDQLPANPQSGGGWRVAKAAHLRLVGEGEPGWSLAVRGDER